MVSRASCWHRSILVWMRTPDEVLPESTAYFRVYFLGSLGICALQQFRRNPAVGRRQPPPAVLSDLFLGGQYRAGSAVCRCAPFRRGLGGGRDGDFTVCQRGALPVPPHVERARTNTVYRFRPPAAESVHADVRSSRTACRPGIQNSVISIANVFVQSNINSFGKIAMAGCGAYSKMEGFAALAGHLLLNGPDDVHQPEPRCAASTTASKRGARFGMSLCGYTLAELDRARPVSGGAACSSPFFDRESGGHRLRCAKQAHNDHAVLFPAGLFSHCTAGIMRGAGKGDGTDARDAALLVSDPSDLYYDRSADFIR